MAVPLLKAQQYLRELSHSWISPPEFRLHQILRDCRYELENVADGQHRALLWLVCGVASGRLQRSEDALAAFENAHRSGIPEDVATFNIGLVHLQSANGAEAAECFLRVADLRCEDGPAELSLLGYLAVALKMNGEDVAAGDVFRLALEQHDPLDPVHLFMLGDVAAFLGDYQLSIEFLVRCFSVRLGRPLDQVSALEFLNGLPDDAWSLVELPPHVDYAIQTLFSYADALRRHAPQIVDEGACAQLDEARAEVMSAMAPHRRRAALARQRLYDGEPPGSTDTSQD